MGRGLNTGTSNSEGPHLRAAEQNLSTIYTKEVQLNVAIRGKSACGRGNFQLPGQGNGRSWRGRGYGRPWHDRG